MNDKEAEKEMKKYCIDPKEAEAEMARLGIKSKDEYLDYYFNRENEAFERRREDELVNEYYFGHHFVF